MTMLGSGGRRHTAASSRDRGSMGPAPDLGPAPAARTAQLARHRPRRGQTVAKLVVDAATLALSFVLGLRALELVRNPQHLVGVPQAWVFLPAYLGAFVVAGAYRCDPQRLLPSMLADIVDTGRSLALGALAALAENDVIGAIGHRELRVAEAVALVLPAAVLVPLARVLVGKLSAAGRLGPRVVVVGTGRTADGVAGRIRRSGRAHLVGMVADGRCPSTGVAPGEGKVLGSVGDLAGLCRQHRVDRVLVAGAVDHEEALGVLRDLATSVTVSIVPRFHELLNFRSSVEELAGIPLVHVAPASLSAGSKAAKRIFDIVVSALAIAILAPLGLVLAVLVKRGSPGPVLFRQARPGRHGEPFTILKFRTMSVDAESRRHEVSSLNEHADTPLFKVRDDPRVTKLGRCLRERHIDELPQLLNVLAGHMSLVGPRPFPTAECESLAPRRFQVRPGMTGLWQVSGRIDLSYDDLLYLDDIYVASWSFWWDIRILLQTPKVLLERRGDGSGRPGWAPSEGGPVQPPNGTRPT